MEDLCEGLRKLIHKELRSQQLDTLIIKTQGSLAGTCIQHAPRNCFLFQQIMKKLVKHQVLSYKCYQVQKNSYNFCWLMIRIKNTVMFSCNTNLQFLTFFDVLYVDWTCKSVPKVFHQLLTIHVLSNGHYVPLAFFLPANKHHTCCEDVLRQYERLQNLV